MLSTAGICNHTADWPCMMTCCCAFLTQLASAATAAASTLGRKQCSCAAAVSAQTHKAPISRNCALASGSSGARYMQFVRLAACIINRMLSRLSVGHCWVELLVHPMQKTTHLVRGIVYCPLCIGHGCSACWHCLWLQCPQARLLCQPRPARASCAEFER